MKIRTKIIIYYITIFLLCFSMVGYFVINSLKDFIVQNSISRLTDHVLLNKDIMLPVFDGGFYEGLLDEYGGLMARNLSKNNMLVRIYDQNSLLAAASSGISLHYPSGRHGLSQLHHAAFQGNRAYLFKQDIIYYVLPIKYRDEVVGANPCDPLP